MSNFPDAIDAAWAKRVANLEMDELDRVRAVAEKWRTALASFTGLVAIAGAAGTPFVGKFLATTPKYCLAGAMLISLIALTFGAWKAMSAAFGVPEQIENSGEALRKWSKDEANTATRQLQVARQAAVVAVIGLTVATGIGIFASGSGSKVSVTDGDDNERCGIAKSDKDGIHITGSDGTVHTVKFSDIKSLDLASDC